MQSSGAEHGVAHGRLSKDTAAHSRLAQNGGTHDGSHCDERWWWSKCRDDLNPSVAENATWRTMDGEAGGKWQIRLRATRGSQSVEKIGTESPSGYDAVWRKVEVVWRKWFPWVLAFEPGIAEDL